MTKKKVTLLLNQMISSFFFKKRKEKKRKKIFFFEEKKKERIDFKLSTSWILNLKKKINGYQHLLEVECEKEYIYIYIYKRTILLHCSMRNQKGISYLFT